MPWTDEALALSYRLAIRLGQFDSEPQRSWATAPEERMATVPINVPVSQGKSVEIEDGTYSVECVRVEEKFIENDRFGNGNKILLWMRFDDVYDEEDQQIELDAMANAVIAPKSKLYIWLTNLGVSIDLESREIDAEAAIGKRAQAVVKHTDPTKDKPKGWARIEDIVPAPKVGRRTGVARRTPEPSQDDDRTPAMITPDYTIDWTVFWKAVRALGMTREAVIEEVGGDVEALMKMDPTDVVELYEVFKGRHVDPDDLPFEG